MVWLPRMRLPGDRFAPLLVGQCQRCAYNIRFAGVMGIVPDFPMTGESSPRASWDVCALQSADRRGDAPALAVLPAARVDPGEIPRQSSGTHGMEVSAGIARCKNARFRGKIDLDSRRIRRRSPGRASPCATAKKE